MNTSLYTLYEFIRKAQYYKTRINSPKDLPKDFLEHSKYFYILSLLETHFSPRKFNIQEIKELLKQSLPYDHLEKEGEKLIPKWYKTKYMM